MRVAIVMLALSLFVVACGGEGSEVVANEAASKLLEGMNAAVEEGQKAESKAAEAKKAEAEKEPFIGTWELDVETAAKEDPAIKKLKGDEAAMAVGMLKSMKMKIEILEGGKMTMTMEAMGKKETEEGTWKLQSSDGDKYKLETKSDKDKELEIIDVTMNGADKIVMSMKDQNIYAKRI